MMTCVVNEFNFQCSTWIIIPTVTCIIPRSVCKDSEENPDADHAGRVQPGMKSVERDAVGAPTCICSLSHYLQLRQAFSPAVCIFSFHPASSSSGQPWWSCASELVAFGWFYGGLKDCGWVVCVLDTIAQLCLRLPRDLHFLFLGSELTRCVAVLLFLDGGSGSLGPLVSVSCAASAGPRYWPKDSPAIQ